MIRRPMIRRPIIVMTILLISLCLSSCAFLDPTMPKRVPGATMTDSRLQYIDTVIGTGVEASAGKRITVHYTGTLENGEKFDSSYDRGAPFTFTLGHKKVIPGWDEGLLGMKVGGRRQLFIPSDLAYGERGVPDTIPPFATLVFDVELLNVQP